MQENIRIAQALIDSAKVYSDGHGIPVLGIHLMRREVDAIQSIINRIKYLEALGDENPLECLV